MVVLRACVSLPLVLLAAEASATPTASPPLEADPLRTGPAWATEPAVTLTASGHVISWLNEDHQLQVTKVTPAGAVPPLALGNQSDWQGDTVLASIGDVTLVVSVRDSDATAVLLGADGSVRRTLGRLDDSGTAPAVATNGQLFLVVGGNDCNYANPCGGDEVWAKLVSPAGDVSPLDPLLLRTSSGTVGGLAAASAGGDFFVRWSGQEQDYPRDVSAELVRLSGAGQITTSCTREESYVFAASMTTDGTTLALSNWPQPETDATFGAVLFDVASFADCDSRTVPFEGGQAAVGYSQLSFDGSAMIATWDQLRTPPAGFTSEIRGSRVGQDGFQDAGGYFLAPSAFPVGADWAIAPDAGSGFVQVRWRAGGLAFQRFDAAGTVAPPGESMLPLPGSSRQRSAVVSHDGNRLFLVWSDSRGDSPGIYGMHFSDSGRRLDPEPVHILDLEWVDNQFQVNQEVELARSASQYLLAWSEAHVLHAARVSFDGTLVDHFQLASVPVGAQLHNVTVASDGAGFVVAWKAVDGGTSSLRGARIASDGTILDGGDKVLVSDASATESKVTYTGTTYLLTWGDSAGGAVKVQALDTNAQPVGQPVSAGCDARSHAIQCGGGVCVLVCTDGSDSVVAQRFDPNGGLLDVTPSTVAQFDQFTPSVTVAYDEQSFVAAWLHNQGIEAARISPAGQVLEAPFAVGVPYRAERLRAASMPGRSAIAFIGPKEFSLSRQAWLTILSSDCEGASDGTACDDGDPCTQTDTCTSEVCAGNAYGCDDGDPCTTDWCNGDGSCSAQPNDAACDDGDPCTAGDRCAQGTCSGTAYSCDLGTACTEGASCDGQGRCTFPADGSACDDGELCSEADECQAGVCAGSFDFDCVGAGNEGGAATGGGGGAVAGGGAGAAERDRTPDDDDSEGCGCRLKATESTEHPLFLSALLWLAWVIRRARRRRAPQSRPRPATSERGASTSTAMSSSRMPASKPVGRRRTAMP